MVSFCDKPAEMRFLCAAGCVPSAVALACSGMSFEGSLCKVLTAD